MKLRIGDKVLNDKNNKVGIIIDWYVDDDGEDESGPIYLYHPIVRYDDGTDDIVSSWHCKKVTEDA